MTSKSLADLCKERGIRKCSGKKKAELIQLLLTPQAATTAEAVRTEGMDKFYTIPKVAEECLAAVGALYSWSRWELVVEPSAGNGSFLSRIPTERKVGIDISPEHDAIIEKNFFEYTPPVTTAVNQILVVGNPPFGKVSSLAIQFFNHAATWANVIAFIVPRTFRRVSVRNRLDHKFHLVHDEEIPTIPCAFQPPMAVKCCFQIWEKRFVMRTFVQLPIVHTDWEFIKFGPKDERGQPTPPEGADFAIRAYGGKCGDIVCVDLNKLRPKSWHWIKANINKKMLMHRFKTLDYTVSLNTARQNSIGRADLVKLYSDIYGG